MFQRGVVDDCCVPRSRRLDGTDPVLDRALLLCLPRRKWREIEVYLLVIVIADRAAGGVRASSLQWDNPRYEPFCFAQVTLAAWAWEESRQRHSPWLWRIAFH